MSVTAADFLQAARIAGTGEMSARISVNRGYYAAYHFALSVSHHCPNPPPLPEGKGEGDHQRLIRRFSSVPQKGFLGAGLARQIGTLLAQGRQLRIKADYDLRDTVTHHDAQRLIMLAERVEQLVKQFTEQHSQ